MLEEEVSAHDDVAKQQGEEKLVIEPPQDVKPTAALGTTIPAALLKPSRIPRYNADIRKTISQLNDYDAFEADVKKVLESFDPSQEEVTPTKSPRPAISGPGTPATPNMTVISPMSPDESLEHRDELFRLTQLLDTPGFTPVESPSVFDVAVDLSGMSLASTPSPARALLESTEDHVTGALAPAEGHTTPMMADREVVVEEPEETKVSVSFSPLAAFPGSLADPEV
eukprot:scaffold216741_cov40-Prasinocladus_malaysianus.AAC.1